MDVIFAGHGFDAPPFPGEQALVMMNNNGIFTASYLSPSGFFHSVASGDIDNDGDLDIFFTDNKNQCKFFINNGSGQFTYNNTIFPADISNLNYFTSELYDVNNDGYLDLIIAGHSHEGAQPMVLWGNYSGKYAKTRSSVLPSVSGWGVIIDINFIDMNGDGLQEIILNRQGDGTGSQQLFHGLYVQILAQQSDRTFSDKTSTYIDQPMVTSHPDLNWFWVDWLRLYDADGDGKKDLVADNKYYNCQWRNLNGKFIKY
ncbi:Repeat domain in Vibrio, Colwellia, Bradyrhizobium and Shewanella [compost metagenome]